MAIINGVGRVGIRSYVAPAPTSSYLLDTYGGASTAYSLRKLSSTYTGFAIRVRRSSDNTEMNIGFDGSGNLDTTTLLAFVGAGNGFVTTWYDQSSAVKTMIQPTATSQPTIVSAGSLISRNGKPIIKFTSANHLYMINDGYVSFDSSNHSFFMTYEKDSTSNKAPLIRNGVSYLFLDYNTTILNGNNGFTINGYTIIPVNSFKLISLTNTWTTSRKFYMNNSVIGTLSGSSAGGCSFGTISSPSFTQGTIYTNEVVTYPTDQVSNIDSINSNINSYYSIYPTYTSRTTAFAAATGISDTTILNALNTFDLGLISNGLDTKMKALYPFVGGTANTHKFNFMDARDVDAAFRLAFNGGWVHSSTGAKPNGTNAYADTFLIPNNVMSSGGDHLSYYSKTNSSNDVDYLIGAETGPPYTYLGIVGKRNSVLGTNGRGHYITSNPTSTYYVARQDNSSRDTRGLFVGTSNGANTYYILNNNILATNTALNTDVTRLTNKLYIAAYPINNVITSNYYTDKECAFASIGNELTTTDASNLYTLTQAFQTSLSRQV